MRWLTRARTSVLLLALSGGLLGLSRVPWLRVTTSGSMRQDVLQAGAADLQPVVPAAALVGLAAAAALSIAGTKARRMVLGLATVASALAVYGCVSVLANPQAAARGLFADRVIPGASSALSPVAWMALVCALGLGVVSVLGQVSCASWPGRKASQGRFERTASTSSTHTAAGDWDALSRGEDPTR